MTKIAAIWARVSDPKQEEPSVDRQVATVKAWLEGQGFTVPDDKILKTVWTSKKILNCPDMQRLLTWVRAGEVKAVGMTHLDRLSGRPGHMSQIFETFKEANCQLLAKDTPLPTGLMGELVALVLTLGKAMQVDKADNGAKDGLRDRVNRKRLPTSKHRVYGYQWASDSELVPDRERPERYEALKTMFSMALNGKTYYDIQKELKRQGILSPSGNPEWDRSSIALIINNPVYAGRYYALKHEVCEPKVRKAAKEGNTSARHKSLDEAVYLPEVKIINPPITWEQYLQLQERHEINRRLAKRNGHRDYLLRGFIRCFTHYGKKGEPRTYFGHPSNGTYYYQCPIGGCAHVNLNGPRIEAEVKEMTRWLLELQPDEFYKYIGNQTNIDQTRESLERELKGLEAKQNRNINSEAELVNLKITGRISDEAYDRERARLLIERQWVHEQRELIHVQLDQLQKQTRIADTWWQLREKVINRLDSLTPGEWRELWIQLNLEIAVRDRQNPATWAEDWQADGEGCVRDSKGFVISDDIEICFGLPIGRVDAHKAKAVSEIVFSRPSPD